MRQTARMITDFDDFAIHQTTNPIAHPSTSDRNFYDRYWFNGFDREGAFAFEVGFGLYPNRFVQDAHFSVVRDGVQHCFHASRRAPSERRDSSVGPLRIEIEEPLRKVRVVLAPNESDLECDLRFSASTTPTEEPKNLLRDGPRLLMENSRFAQFGSWEGHFSIAGKQRSVVTAETSGTRDRSWGIRPLGEPEAGAPGRLARPGVYWIWAPLQFDDVCTQFGSFEDPDGRATQVSACIVPRYSDTASVPAEEDGHREFVEVRHRVHWQSGTRRPAGAEIDLLTREGEKVHIELEALMRFQMQAIGYQHPEWAHGHWKGELATGAESYVLDDLDPLGLENIHIHTIVKARMKGLGKERRGVGTLETICFGPHAPSGFAEMLDGAS